MDEKKRPLTVYERVKQEEEAEKARLVKVEVTRVEREKPKTIQVKVVDGKVTGLARQEVIRQAARIFAEGNKDEWLYFLSLMSSYTEDFNALLLSIKQEIEAKLNDPNKGILRT